MCSISVLIAVYYKEKPVFLNDALSSIWVDQTLKPTQIVLVEDGKLTPELYDVLGFWEKEIGSSFIRIALDENQGLTKALNIGITYCKGEYIARMDSDDKSFPDRFEKQVLFLEKNKDVDVLGGAIQEISEDGSYLNIRTYPQTHANITRFIVKASPFAHPTVMFRSKVFIDGMRYNEEYITSQDLEFWYRLIKKGYKLANLNDVIFYFRRTEDFFSRRSKKKAFNESLIYIRGTYSLFGIKLSMIYPIIRYFMRLTPYFISKRIYNSKLRQTLNKN